MIKGYQEQVLAMYEKIRKLEQKSLEERRKEVSFKCPEALTIERNISRLCLQVSMNALKSLEDRDSIFTKLKNIWFLYK